MKYQSELIKEIVEARGHKKSSLHYESECAETWIEEAKGGYPKLCDYESEWLYYISILDDTGGEFPYVVLSNVTEATVDNVVPYAYKSAVLKGKTLVNLCETSGKDLIYTDTNSVSKLNHPIEANKWYYMIINVKQNTFEKPFRFSGWTFAGGCKAMVGSQIGTNDIALFNAGETGVKGFKLGYSEIVDGLGKTLIMFVDKSSGETLTGKIVYDIMFLEYQEGMENYDIPYFEGIQSVKMPVLKTVGKNLFDGELEDGGYTDKKGEKEQSSNTLRSANFIKVEPSSTICCSNNGIARATHIYQYDENKKFLKFSSRITKATLLSSTKYITFCGGKEDRDKMQIEYGEEPTSYEPYKSNILSASEEVELRGIGDVQDTLDCLTGEVVEHIGEIVLDGSDDENWSTGELDENSVPFFQSIIKGRKGNDKLICDKLIVRKDNASDKIAVSTTVFGIMGTASNSIRIKNGATSLKEFKQWLSQNPITVQYELATESIKTVDLLVQNQDGKTLSVIKPIEGTMHLSTSSDTIKPLFSGEIPVEAITQNLASFVDLEMEE